MGLKQDVNKVLNDRKTEINLNLANIMTELSEGVFTSLKMMTDFVKNDINMIDERLEIAERLIKYMIPTRSEVEGSGLPEIDFDAIKNLFLNEAETRL